jgi:hypothetical protein
MSRAAVPLSNLVRPASAVSEPAQGWLGSLPQRLLPAFGIIVLLSYAVLAAAHIRDRYQVNFVSGVYTALAMHLNEGTFYPDLYDGSRYGGTRYMPLQFVLQAGLARLTGEYLFSGKLLTSMLGLILIAQLFSILRTCKCSSPVSLALCPLVVLTEPGMGALTNIRGDLLPVVLQLAALQIAFRGLTWQRALLAALFCTLALLSKVSAVWAPLAIVCFTLRRQRGLSLAFVGVWLTFAALSVFLLDQLSAGRMLGNLRAFSGSGVGSLASLLGPLLFFWRIGQGGLLLTLLFPLALVEAARALRLRELNLYHCAMGCCLLVTLGIYFDKEVTSNHLLDLIVLAIPMLGCLWSYVASRTEAEGSPRLAPVLGLLVLWGMYMAWANTLVQPCFEAIQTIREGATAAHYPTKPLANLIKDSDRILAEDAWVAISRKQVPTVLDPYSLGRMNQSRPELVAPLIQRVQNQEFQWIVLSHDMNGSDRLDRYRWEDRHFGPPLVKAMREAYQLHSKGKGFFVYAPRPGSN